MVLRAVLVAGIFIVPVLVLGAGASEPSEPAPETDREGTPITFYGYIFSFGRNNPMPMNTQFPEGVGDFSYGSGSGGCGEPPPAPDGSNPALPPCSDFAENEMFWYTTAGFVPIKSFDEMCAPSTLANACDYSLIHNERGQTKDIYMDPSKPVTGLFHMSADFHGWPGNACDFGVCWNWDPGYFQDWTVEATIWHANLGEWGQNQSDPPDVAPIVQRADGAVQVAHGRSEPFDMLSLDPTLPLGERTVWPIPVELDWDPDFIEAGAVVPRQNDVIVEWEWYQYTDGQEYILSTPFAGAVWNLNGGEDYPSKVVMPVRNPLDVELVLPRFVHDKLAILGIINTPWGSYDVDSALVELSIIGPDGHPVEPIPGSIERHLDASVAHAGHFRPVNATWVWDYRGQDLPPGEYTVSVAATNFQHSARASTSAYFTIGEGGVGLEARHGEGGLASYSEVDLESSQAQASRLARDSEAPGLPDAPAPPLDRSTGVLEPAIALTALALAGCAVRRRRNRR